MFTKNPNDCKIKKRKLCQMQQYYVNGKTGSFYQLMKRLSREYPDQRKEIEEYVNSLPEYDAEDVLKKIQQDRGEREVTK